MSNIYLTKTDFENENKGVLPYSDEVSSLAEKLHIGKKVVANRLVCQAMEGCDGTADGVPGELTNRRYKRLARGGAGLIWFEATAVMSEGRANPHQLNINNNNLDAFKRQVEDIKETGLRENGFEPVVIMQATHSGRYSKPNGTAEPLIAYNNSIFEKDNQIDCERIVTDEYLDKVKDALVRASVLAQKAGFDGVDIKACHRYLNSELLSAYNRGGRYGGSLENRSRLLRESIGGAIQNTKGDFIVTTRLNVYDGFVYPYGFGVADDNTINIDLSEPIKLVKELRDMGVKLVNITMGNPYFNPHVNRPFASGGYEPPEHPLCGVVRMLHGTAEIKRNVPRMNLICSGITYLGTVAPNVVSAFIKNGDFDMAGFGRTIFAYPDFANDIIKKGKMEPKKLCIACSKCTEVMRAGGTPGCVIRDTETYLPIYKKYCGGIK